MHRAFFIIPPEVHLLDITGPIHVFHEASTSETPIKCHFLSLNDQTRITANTGIALAELEDFSKYSLTQQDWLFIPGLEREYMFDPLFQKRNRTFYEWLRQQYLNQAKVCSVCTGTFLLAQAGLLDGKQCTTHWKYIDTFKKQFPKANVLQDRLFVKDQNLYSSAGVSSGIDLALYLIEEAFGPFFATQIAKEVVLYIRRAEGDPQISIFLQYRNHIDNRVHRVQDILAQNLHQKIKIEDLAEQVNMSTRNLTRSFKKTTGITIGTYLEKLRAERAVDLLAAGQKVEVVARSCGLNSSNQLRSILKKYASALPSELKI